MTNDPHDTDRPATPSRGLLSRAYQWSFVAHRRSWVQLIKFCIVGGSGFIVNLAVFWALLETVGHPYRVFWDIPGTEYNVRSYHVYSTIAFIVANASNFLINRAWTFRTRGHTRWTEEYVPFLVIGVVAQAFALLLLTILLHRDSPLHMDSEIAAQAITIVLVTPISFIGNKLWTFRAVLGSRGDTDAA